jgi:acyl transferase domain-containing protein
MTSAATSASSSELAAYLDFDLRTAFVPGAAATPVSGAAALFAYELALAETLRTWGVAPELLVGAGVGEIAAAVLAGTLAVSDAAALVGLWAGHPSPAAWAAAVADLPRRAPEIPWISAATAGRVEAGEATDPQRWAERLAAEPRLGATLAPLLADRSRLLLPIGPAAALAAAARTAAGEAGEAAIATALPAAADLPAPAAWLATLGNLWLAGIEIDWKSYHRGEARRRVPLPTYPFERQRYWIEAPADSDALRSLEAAAADDV